MEYFIDLMDDDTIDEIDDDDVTILPYSFVVLGDDYPLQRLAVQQEMLEDQNLDF